MVSNDTSSYIMEEKACQSYFDQTVRQGSDGKFIIKLLSKIEVKEIGNSYSTRAMVSFFGKTI